MSITYSMVFVDKETIWVVYLKDEYGRTTRIADFPYEEMAKEYIKENFEANVGKVKVIDVTSVGHCSKCQRLIEENN